MNAEAKLLRSAGLEVIQHDADNSEDGWRSMRRTLKLALSSAWSQSSWHLVRHLCRLHRPDILHVHNFWTALTPSVHAAAHSEGVPTVQTLHNYRLLCTNALLLRNDKPCVECVGKSPWRGVVHKCYRNSFASSAAVARMIVSNRARQTWSSIGMAGCADSALHLFREFATQRPTGRRTGSFGARNEREF